MNLRSIENRYAQKLCRMVETICYTRLCKKSTNHILSNEYLLLISHGK